MTKEANEIAKQCGMSEAEARQLAVMMEKAVEFMVKEDLDPAWALEAAHDHLAQFYANCSMTGYSDHTTDQSKHFMHAAAEQTYAALRAA